MGLPACSDKDEDYSQFSREGGEDEGKRRLIGLLINRTTGGVRDGCEGTLFEHHHVQAR